MEKPNCAGCHFYDPTVEIDVYLPHNWGAMSYPPSPPIKECGGCRRYPHTTPRKRPDEWCGEHPAFKT